MKNIVNVLLISLFHISAFGQILQPASIHLPTAYEQGDVEQTVLLTFPALQFSGSELALSLYKETPGGCYWTFAQQIQGKPIYQSSIMVKVNADRRIPFFMNNLQTKTLSLTSGKDRFYLTPTGVQVLLLKKMPAFSHEVEAIWFPVEKQLQAAYLVRSYAHLGTESYELILDAQTGQEIQRRDIRAYHSHALMSDTTGRGRVFRPNPCTAAAMEYGVAFANNDDMHLPIFEQYMDTVMLKDLTYENGQFVLKGPYVEIQEFSIPNVQPVTSSDGAFFFKRDEFGFEDVMAYYHIDTFQRYVQSLGYTDLYSTTPIQVDAHGAGGNDQSSFSTNGRIQFGTNYTARNEHVDDAEDADVIIHEYGHALSHGAAPNTRSGNERIGIEEGYGDYFAAAYSYDIRSDYGWDKVFNWDGHNEFWDGRSADTDRKYRPTGFNRYQYGEIWASAMMRLRQDIGGTTCDKLQLEMLYGQANNMTFWDAYQLVLHADTALFGGVHSLHITHRFCEIEVVTGAACIGVSIVDDFFENKWLINYLPGEGISIACTGQPISEPLNIRITNTLGQQLVDQSFAGNSMTIPTKSSGIYVVSLWKNEELLGSQKVVVW